FNLFLLFTSQPISVQDIQGFGIISVRKILFPNWPAIFGQLSQSLSAIGRDLQYSRQNRNCK
ncbi:MAG: hypothetical protein ACI3YQ_00385, partial [Prevotella sp.]